MAARRGSSDGSCALRARSGAIRRAIAAIAPAAALYSFALTRGRVHLVVAVIGAAAAVVVADTLLSPHHSHALALQTAGHVALVAVPVLAAEALRNRRGYVELLRERLTEAERSREEEAQRRVEQERLRIARDFHDVVAHTLSTINVQAGVAAHLSGDESSPARSALTTIEAASHEALEELRTIVGVLRRDGDGGDPPLEPAPGLDEISGLIEQTRARGAEVVFSTRGKRPERVADAVQLATYRILQESLTNVRRHAPGASARVDLVYGGDDIQLTITNDVRAAATRAARPGVGVGITGMRERAAALGGTVDVTARDGSFAVSACLPYRRRG